MGEEILLKKYCLIGLDQIEEIKEDLEYISESVVNFATGENLIIATFKTSLNIIEVEDFLNSHSRAYIIFEMLPAIYSANLLLDKFQQTLFGGKIDNTEFLPLFQARGNMENIMGEMMDLKQTLKGDIIDIEPIKPTMDELLDKIGKVGLENLSKIEKEYLKQYSEEQ